MPQTPDPTLPLACLPALLLSAVLALSLEAQSPSASERLSTLCRDYYEAWLRNSPTWATYLGDRRYDDRLPSIGAAARADQAAERAGFAQRAAALDESGLSPAERVTLDILRRTLALHEEEESHRLFEWNVDQMFGPQVWFFEVLNSHPLKTEKNFEDLASRMEAFPGHLEHYVADLKAGLASGRVAPRIAVERVIAQLRAIAATTPETSPLAAAEASLPAGFPAESRARLADRLRRGIGEAVLPAYRRWLAFMEQEYLPASRTAVGLSALPGGAEAYRFLIRKHTTTALTAEDLHRIGQEELAGIHAETAEVARRMGFDGGPLEFLAHLRATKSNFATSREALLEGYRAILAEADAKLPQWFGRLPKARCEVKAIEEYREKDSVAAFYYEPPEDGSRPGFFYANTYDPPSRPLYNMRALTIHEAVPGHHLQIALAKELTDLPDFRRHAGFTAFVEGWALYAERLADEMGLYPDDLSRAGMLTYQAWRASRLVVDTGIHALGWDRAKAIEFMTRNVALSDTEIANEVDRYIIWPGQALAYKVGQREIERLRQHAQERLGSRFDVRRFHDAVLRNGAVPLATLEAIVQDWIAEESGDEGR